MQIDPFSNKGGQENLSSYHFGGNNPILNNDPDGQCPWCIVVAVKFLVDAAVEYGSQVYDNYQSGKTGAEAWKPQSFGKILLNGGTSSVDPSGGVAKKIAIGAATNIVESVGGQILDGEDVSLQKTLTDVTVMSVSSHVKIDDSKIVSNLDKKADRLERIAANSPSKRNGVQANEARKTANKANFKNEAAGTATTETTESAGGKKVDQIDFRIRSRGGTMEWEGMKKDNTGFPQKPLPVIVQ